MEKPWATNWSSVLFAMCLVVSLALVSLAGMRDGMPAMSKLGWATHDVAEILVEEKCDMSRGKWVREPSGPLYTNLTCPTLPDTKNCQKYGKDPGHLYWRWQPDGCDLPRFSPARFLDAVRGKRLGFVGDSLARNQMDSLLCLLSQAETPTQIVRGDASSWHFPAHDFTVTAIWTAFFVHAVPVRGADGRPLSSFDIQPERLRTNWTMPGMEVHLDRVDAGWTGRLRGLDYAVVSGGNWFFRENFLWERGRRVGCVNCRERNLTDVGVPRAVRRVVRAALEAIARCRGCKRGLVTLLRTYSPDHFERGSWYNGGRCDRTRPLRGGEEVVGSGSIGWRLRNVQREEVRRVAGRASASASGKRFGVLDVTRAMMLRADGHPGWHHGKRRFTNDCLHWCLPGPVDMWNDALLQRLADISPPAVVP